MAEVIVFGAGAVGCLIGGLLSRHGTDVAYIGRKRIVEAIRENGFRITGCWGEFSTSPNSLAFETLEPSVFTKPPELIVITTKAYATREAAAACAPIVGPETRIISIQNGIGNMEILAERFGWERTIGGLLFTGVDLHYDAERSDDPLSIEVTAQHTGVNLGHPHGNVPRAEIDRIAERWKAAGIPVVVPDELVPLQWGKMFYNASLNPLGAIMQVPNGPLAEHPGTHAILDRIIREAYAVSAADGVRHLWPTVEAYLEFFYGRLVAVSPEHISSMTRDIERGRRTEIDAINGAIVRLGEKYGIDVTTNRCMVEMVKFLEGGIT